MFQKRFFLNFFQSQTRIVHGFVVCDICQIKIKCGIFAISTSQTPLVLSYISFGLVLSESKIFKAFISQSETIISHGGHAFLCNIHSKIMNFYEGVSREIYEKSKSNEQ